MDKKKLISPIIAIIIISSIILLALYWTSASVVSGGFSDPKAIILIPNETRNVEISTHSIISQNILLDVTVNDFGIGVLSPCATSICIGEGMSTIQTTPSKAIFQLKILDNTLPNGEYELKIRTRSVPFYGISFVYQTQVIPVYVGYHIKDE